MKHSSKNNKQDIVNEIILAKTNGFVYRIDFLLKDLGKIIYEVDVHRVNTNFFSDVCVNIKSSLATYPEFYSICVYFSNKATKNSLEKICEYLIKRYNCICCVDGNKLKISGITC